MLLRSLSFMAINPLIRPRCPHLKISKNIPILYWPRSSRLVAHREPLSKRVFLLSAIHYDSLNSRTFGSLGKVENNRSLLGLGSLRSFRRTTGDTLQGIVDLTVIYDQVAMVSLDAIKNLLNRDVSISGVEGLNGPSQGCIHVVGCVVVIDHGYIMDYFLKRVTKKIKLFLNFNNVRILLIPPIQNLIAFNF